MQLIKLHFNNVCKDKPKRRIKFSDFFFFLFDSSVEFYISEIRF